MKSTLAAQLRRMQRMMRPIKMTKATRSIMVASAFSPFTAIHATPSKRRKSAATNAGHTLGLMMNQMRFTPRASHSAAVHTAVPRIPPGAQYTVQRHRSKWGSRAYTLYLPANAPKKPKGLILMLHGCGQTPNDFAVGTHMNALAEKHSLVIAYPAQTDRHNRASCWNWFDPAHQARGAGEPAVLASLARKLAKELHLNRDAVFVAGLSAGGAMAAILADVYPDVFAAAGIHSGLARGTAHNVSSAMSAMRNGGSDGKQLTVDSNGGSVRRIIFQGDDDGTVHPSNAPLIVTAALGDDAVPTRITRRSVRGRGYTRSDFSEQAGGGGLELWILEGTGHAWSGGRVGGSYTDKHGPDASAHFVRFFLAKSK